MNGKKSSWHGPKQLGIMLYTALAMLVGACLSGGSTNTILPVIAEKYSWDVNILRTWAGIGTCLVVVGSFVFARICAKKGPKLAIMISMLVTVVFCCIYGSTSSYPLFIATILVISIMAGGYYQAGVASLTANWWPTKKGMVLGITTMAIPFMDIVWQPVIPVAFHKIGTEKTMFIVAGLVLVLALFGLRVKNTPEEAGEYADGDSENAENIEAVAREMREYKSPFGFSRLMKTGPAWGIALGMGICFMVAMTYVASIVPRMLSCGYAYNQATLILIVCGALAMAGSFVIGLLDQKLGTKKANLIFIICLVIAMVVALFHQQSIVMVWISSIIFFSANGGCGNLIPSSVGTVFGRWDYASAYSLIGPITSLFAGIGVILSSVFPSYQAMYIFDIVMLAIAFLLIGTTKFQMIGKKG